MSSIFVFIVGYFNLPEFCPNSTWNSNGTIYPNKTKDLNQPRSIFVDIKDTVYVSYANKGTVIVWPNETYEPSRIYNSDKMGNDSTAISDFWSTLNSIIKDAIDTFRNWWNGIKPSEKPPDETLIQLNISNSLFVTSNEDIYVGDSENKRINKWLHGATLIKVALSGYSSCYGLFVDFKDTLYCSSRESHTVIKKSSPHQDKEWINAAGTNVSGSDSYALSYPFGIFVNDNSDLYVADWGNNRIQLFKSEKLNGQTAVNKTVLFDGKSLKHPTNIMLDSYNNLYIVDSENHRVVFASADSSVYRCLIGCSGDPGSENYRLKVPSGMSFDSSGNILITDSNNDRVMRFQLQAQSCDQLKTTTTTITTTTTTTTTEIAETFKTKLTTFETASNTFTDTSLTDALDTVTTSPSIGQFSETTIEDKKSTSEISSIGSSRATTSTKGLKTTTKLLENTSLKSSYFVPNNCPDSNYIGSACNISTNSCDVLKPCKDPDSCRNDLTQPNGYICELKVEPCQSNPCLNDGTCISLNDTNFECNCTKYRTGTHCEFWIDYCHNITCLNRGRCRSIPPNYTCICISSSFSGRHCEKVARGILIRQYVSTSFGYGGIIALCAVAVFVIIMDILKYGFGIDPVQTERDRMNRKRMNNIKKSKH